MIFSLKRWHLLFVSPILVGFFPNLSWAGEAPFKPLPSSNGVVVVCPHQSEGQSQVLVCGGGIYVIVREEILVPVSPAAQPAQLQLYPNQFPLELSDPYRGYPGSDGIPAGVIGH